MRRTKTPAQWRWRARRRQEFLRHGRRLEQRQPDKRPVETVGLRGDDALTVESRRTKAQSAPRAESPTSSITSAALAPPRVPASPALAHKRPRQPTNHHASEASGLSALLHPAVACARCEPGLTRWVPCQLWTRCPLPDAGSHSDDVGSTLNAQATSRVEPAQSSAYRANRHWIVCVPCRSRRFASAFVMSNSLPGTFGPRSTTWVRTSRPWKRT